MPKEKTAKQLCVDDLRHAEYYGMQKTFDELYAKSQAGEQFTDLMKYVLQRENILLAYRNIKANTGSSTAGTDGLTIGHIGRLTPDEVVEKVRYILAGSKHGYRPKPVRRKDIPKPYDSTKTRPLGIPCIWDRLIQQCIKQVMEPICEAKFYNDSYGFRPNRSVEHAIARTYLLLNHSHMHYVIEFDIKGFFDNVNHSKLIRQIWSLGIRDKHLLSKIKRILTAPIKMPDGKIIYPEKGTPQGGIISPLLANIVLNELDYWIDSQWRNNPITQNCTSGSNHGSGYKKMRKTKLKEMYIVRYADDFRIFCSNKTDAQKTMIAVTQWLKDRLKLEISPEKTRIVNVKRRYSDFLGFKIKVHAKGNKWVVKSHVSDKQLARKRQNLVGQAKKIAAPRCGRSEIDEIKLYNAMVMGMQNYYCLATHVNIDFRSLNRSTITVLTNRLKTQRGSRLVKTGRELTKIEKERFGKSQMLRFVAGTEEPIYPVGYIQCKKPMNKKGSINSYTSDGRIGLHDNLRINTPLMLRLMQQPLRGRSIEYADNRISLFCAQWGKCAVTGKDFRFPEEIHCHHKIPKAKGGTDKYENLVLVLEPVHRLIHAEELELIARYIQSLGLDSGQIAKIDKLRLMMGQKVDA